MQPQQFISLNCQNCGAQLEIYDDMDRFACGYCGSIMLVQRRGGTVALKGIEAAIRSVQAGTDKMAAELALVRLDRELNDARRAALRLIETEPFRPAPNWWAILGLFLFLFTFIPAILILAFGDGVPLRIAGAIGVAVFGGTEILVLRAHTRRRRRFHAAQREARESRLQPARERVEAIEAEIAANRKVLCL